MRHLRSDYDAIQPWPVKRPHIAKQDGRTVQVPTDDIDAEVQVKIGRVQPLIPDDEPVFLLRGQDPAAAEAVMAWADAVESRGGDPVLAARVREWAMEMHAYALAKHHGAPDVPEGMLR
jgi:hypothetical protein